MNKDERIAELEAELAELRAELATWRDMLSATGCVGDGEDTT